ncbi:FprA family A-type flavoprotein [Entomomonas moraniae]|uniref:FprA family A-type flavoprotein n=1 Tax=Entomomonas moraniae TaxID=2213226 RepID=A0A3S9XG14_9GAMM|nr:MBL fold metallo-hydrolase [Entomomonas moraniae]AZS51372.1 FprA family A-type flavoprotein [Entomomonas moraniae]
MRRDPITLFDNGTHKCVCFDSLVTGGGVQSNQFVIIDNDQTILLDPGGDLTYTTLTLEIAKHLSLKSLTYIFASHQDPDIVASLDKWLLHTNAKVICSALWARFLPHLVATYLSNSHGVKTYERIIQLPDPGDFIKLGNCKLMAIPAHFLHSEGNFQIYDPVSKILFSGDLGASIVDDANPVTNFEEHLPNMLGFHQRYMISNKINRYWANMIRGLDIEMMVPQHGRPFKGKQMVNQFINWFENLHCGVDLMTQQNYTLPIG